MLPVCLTAHFAFSGERLWIDAEHAVAVPDAYPVTEGHIIRRERQAQVGGLLLDCEKSIAVKPALTMAPFSNQLV